MLNRVSTFHFLAPDPSVLILRLIFLPKTEPGEISYVVPTAEFATCVWVSWRDKLMLWVPQHYHISPAGESTSCREVLTVWLPKRLNYMGKEEIFPEGHFCILAPVLDVVTGCMPCDCEVLTSVVDGGIFCDKLPC